MKHHIAELPPDPARDQRLGVYRDLLLKWNASINLVAGKTAAEVDRRHIADSLQLTPLMPIHGAIADLGSGGGLPGIVLAAAFPEREIHLVESDRRKAAFLIEVAGTLKLSRVKIHPERIEQARLPPIAVVTARALAPLDALLRFASKLLAPGGVAVLPKGRSVEQELTSATRHWHFLTERFASRTDPEATILRLSEIRLVRDV